MVGEAAGGEGSQYFKSVQGFMVVAIIGTVRWPMMITAYVGETYNYDVAPWGKRK